jgi:hypothetical protein
MTIRTALAATAIVVLMSVPASPVAPDGAHAAPQAVPRTILALYDSAVSRHPRHTLMHGFAEAPLNHLGLLVRYHDLRRGLPGPQSLADVRGVLTWFQTERMPDPRRYLAWMADVSTRGKPFVILGNIGALFDEKGRATPLSVVNGALERLGWRYEGGWTTTTYDGGYLVRDAMLGFERPMPRLIPPYARTLATAADARSLLRVGVPHQPATLSDVVIVSPRGAYVAPGFAHFSHRVGVRDFRQWYLNPFEFFGQAFGADEVPKPDTATLVGRRIYYSHIDGDGWRNLTQVEPHRTRFVIAARVVLDEVIRGFPDLPVTVGAIVGDLDPRWQGTKEGLAVAREIYAEPHVEAAIHTYSHPLDWGYFESGYDPARERRYADENRGALSGSDLLHHDGYAKPRVYDTEPFSVEAEIDRAAAFVNRILPPGKRVTLVQWSGDTKPFEAVLARARAAGLENLNGGDTRFDREFPSLAWVSPLGERVGDELQIYASNSNENTYTDLWQDRFFGFTFLSRTVSNTGLPRRLRPFNLYYHMYSGERLSSLNAVLANLRFARTQPLVPIEASRFSRIVRGFHDVSMVKVGDRAWEVRTRGALQTIRFDRAVLDGVDFSASRGVVGQRHELGSLYVALDEAESTPRIVLKRIDRASGEPHEPVPYLIDSRWRVFGLERGPRRARFLTQGYGPGESRWRWPGDAPREARWRSLSSGRSGTAAATLVAGVLAIRLPQLPGEQVEVVLSVEAAYGSR